MSGRGLASYKSILINEHAPLQLYNNLVNYWIIYKSKLNKKVAALTVQQDQMPPPSNCV